ncbi:uncharacterized protein KY384_007298 [Bacidia gigantensis]|uniref:uncharacterized protein n=1 Tax=Bacidia gigantensis TaxID=2732470 RepID=UPI001D03D07B|nr:uncharacterized protein KY384_007298 [Bacidia gigantensis]KAG8528380.1 hypothetical protein KY384_007298 [Bacidia gigantensis]
MGHVSKTSTIVSTATSPSSNVLPSSTSSGSTPTGNPIKPLVADNRNRRTIIIASVIPSILAVTLAVGVGIFSYRKRKERRDHFNTLSQDGDGQPYFQQKAELDHEGPRRNELQATTTLPELQSGGQVAELIADTPARGIPLLPELRGPEHSQELASL